jgi:hypothetical protein
LCRYVEVELEHAERVCQAVGAGPLPGELWAAAVALGDALAEYKRLDSRLKSAALEVGITDDAWFAIKRGC